MITSRRPETMFELKEKNVIKCNEIELRLGSIIWVVYIRIGWNETSCFVFYSFPSNKTIQAIEC